MKTDVSALGRGLVIYVAVCTVDVLCNVSYPDLGIHTHIYCPGGSSIPCTHISVLVLTV